MGDGGKRAPLRWTRKEVWREAGTPSAGRPGDTVCMDRVEKFVSRSGIRVYGMPVETFGVREQHLPHRRRWDVTLVDVGSGH
jgi:hypothetical protein